MNNYKESQLTGTQWIRATRVVVENPYNQNPTINFIEEAAMSVGASGENIITRLCGNLIESFNPSKEVPILDLITGEPTGLTFNHMELYQMLNSLYMQLAIERDNSIIL